jgi:hypothetical protein
MKFNLPLVAFITFFIGIAQTISGQSKNIEEALMLKKQMAANSLVKNIPFSSIGPTVMSGRVVDIDVNPQEPTEFYVAYASGGLWYTVFGIQIIMVPHFHP